MPRGRAFKRPAKTLWWWWWWQQLRITSGRLPLIGGSISKYTRYINRDHLITSKKGITHSLDNFGTLTFERLRLNSVERGMHAREVRLKCMACRAPNRPLDRIDCGIEQPACRATAVSGAFYPVRAHPLRVQPIHVLLRDDICGSRREHLGQGRLDGWNQEPIDWE